MSSIQSNLCQQPPLYSDHFFSSWWTKKAIHWLLIKGRYTLGDKLQQIASCVLENFCENLCRCNRILSPQQVAQIQSYLFFCDLLHRQNPVVETKIFTKILQTHEVICHDLSLRHVCRLTVLLQLVARPVHMEWSVATTCGYNNTCRLVCTDFKTSLQ